MKKLLASDSTKAMLIYKRIGFIPFLKLFVKKKFNFFFMFFLHLFIYLFFNNNFKKCYIFIYIIY